MVVFCLQHSAVALDLLFGPRFMLFNRSACINRHCISEMANNYRMIRLNRRERKNKERILYKNEKGSENWCDDVDRTKKNNGKVSNNRNRKSKKTHTAK